MFQKKKRRKIEGEFSFLQTNLGATSHTVYYGRQKSRREERKTERGPARKEEGLLGFFSFFSFFFFFFVVGKSFLEQREKTFSALEKKIWCWRLW